MSQFYHPQYGYHILILSSTFYHPHFIIRILSSAFYHPHFIIRIFPSAFFHPHFSIRILSSAFLHPHFIICTFLSAIRHPLPSGLHFTETPRRQVYEYIASTKKFCKCLFLLWIEVLNPKCQAYTRNSFKSCGVTLTRDFLLPSSAVNARSLAIKLFK